MKILQVSSASYTTGGGVSEYIKNISKRLAAHHEVTVFASRTSYELKRKEVVDGVKVERYHCFAPNSAFYLSFELPIKISAAKFDVIHAHGYHSFPMHVAWLGKSRKFLVSPIFHGMGHTSFRNSLFHAFKPFGKKSLERADCILAASEYEKTLLSRYFGFKSERIVVIPRGVDFSEFKGLKRQKRDFKSVLFVGKLVKYKGAQHLIEALPKLDDDIVLEIVGKGPLRQYLEERAKKLGVFPRVHFYKDLTRRMLLQMYANCDVFVLPSRYEAYSKVVAEALTVGKPCVVTNTSALTEWIDNESCFGIDISNITHGIVRQIHRALELPSTQRIGKKWVGTKIIDWDTVVEKLEKLYAD
jgi:glycosyltransferase involved in cell wall biosynthesis